MFNFYSASGATVFFANDRFTKLGIDWCEEEKARYDVLNDWLGQQQYSLEARICANLYEDPLWAYQGSDRVERLIERSHFYVLAEIEESKEEAGKGVIDPQPAKVKSEVLALEQWKSGEISEEEVDKILSEKGYSESEMEEMKSKYRKSEPIKITVEDTSTAGIEGDDSPPDNQESTSGGGCLIATATFGTEMAPQVQQLRELRDSKILNSKIGAEFMTGFNQFYYSFSPVIADYERESPFFKEIVKVTITPLLTSLSILDLVEMDSEESVLGFGIGIISLNIAMYFGVPAFLSFKFFRKN